MNERLCMCDTDQRYVQHVALFPFLFTAPVHNNAFYITRTNEQQQHSAFIRVFVRFLCAQHLIQPPEVSTLDMDDDAAGCSALPSESTDCRREGCCSCWSADSWCVRSLASCARGKSFEEIRYQAFLRRALRAERRGDAFDLHLRAARW